MVTMARHSSRQYYYNVSIEEGKIYNDILVDCT